MAIPVAMANGHAHSVNGASRPMAWATTGCRPNVNGAVSIECLGVDAFAVRSAVTPDDAVGDLGVTRPGSALLAAFLAWEARAAEPMLPLGILRRRASVVANGISFLMSFGMFGSIFLFSQLFQVVQGVGPLEAGLRCLPWTAMPVVVAPSPG